MAYQVYITVTGTKQGAFKGGVMEKGREGKIKAIAVSYGVSIPRDNASGLAVGKRVQKPVSFSLEWDICSPLFFNAAFTNETLKSVTIEYYGTGRDGLAKVDHTVVLTNASISDITESYAAVVNGVADGRDIQTVTVTFQKIAITSNTGNTTAVDDWNSSSV